MIRKTLSILLFTFFTQVVVGQSPIAIKNVTVIDVINAKSDVHTVLIRNGEIEMIGDPALKIKKEYTIINGQGKFLIPGLINCYTHIHEFNTSLYLLHGITTVRDAPSMGHLPGLAEKISRGELFGPEIYLTGNALSGVPTAFPSQHPLQTESDARLAVRETKQMGYQSLFIYGSMSPVIYPFILDEASRQQIDITGHFPSQVPIAQIQNGQQRSFDNLSGLVRSGNWRYDSAIVESLFADMVTKKRYLIPTLTVHKARANGPQAEELLKQERMNYVSRLTRAEWADLRNSPFIRSGYNYAGTKKLVQRAYQKGVVILPGSDGGFPLVVDGFAYIDELKNLKEIGMKDVEILQAATIRAAEFMRWQDRIGSIEVGKEADLLLLDKNPLQNIDHVKEITGLIVNGKWLTHAALIKQANSQRDQMNNQKSPVKTATINLEIVKQGVKVGEESIQMDTVGSSVHVLSHNFMEGPYYRETKSDFYFSQNRPVSSRISQKRIDGEIKVLAKREKDSITFSGTAPYLGSFKYSEPINATQFLIAGPMQGWHLPADVWVNYYLLAKRNLALNVNTTSSVQVWQVELNSEEFSKTFVYDQENYRITKLKGSNNGHVQFLITQPAAQGEKFRSSNSGDITVFVTFDDTGKLVSIEANTGNGKIEALPKKK